MEVLTCPHHASNVLSYFYTMYVQNRHCDVTLRSSDNVTFQAHKGVVTCSSIVIREKIESQTKTTSIDAVDPEGHKDSETSKEIQLNVESVHLAILLEFAYTGQLTIHQNLVTDVMEAAQWLKMTNAVDICIEYLHRSTPTTANRGSLSHTLESNARSVPSKCFNSEVTCSEKTVKVQAENNLALVESSVGCNSYTITMNEESSSDNLVDNDSTEEWTLPGRTRKSRTKSTPGISGTRTTRTKRSPGKTDPEVILETPTRRQPKRRKSGSNFDSELFVTKFSSVKNTRRKTKSTKFVNHSKKDETTISRRGDCKPRRKLKFRKSHQCPICFRWFAGNTELINHGKHVHMRGKLVQELMAPVICSRYRKIACRMLAIKTRNSQVHVDSKNINKLKYHHLRVKRFTVESCFKHVTLYQRYQKLMRNYSQKGKTSNRAEEFNLATPAPNKRQRRPAPIELCLTCGVCHVVIATRQGLLIHLEKVHSFTREMVYQHPCYQITCDVKDCAFQSHSKKVVEQHIKSQHPLVRHFCPHCRLLFYLKSALDSHIFMRHVAQIKKRHNFACGMCDRSFAKGGRLKMHQFTKHGVEHDLKIFRCDFDGCDYVCCYKTSMQQHQSKHSQAKLFRCEFCGLMLKTMLTLRKHVDKIHLNIRPFLCEVCGQAFGEEHEVQSHRRQVHATEKEFVCEVCSFATANKHTFEMHMFRLHNVTIQPSKRKELKCPHCTFATLLRHQYQTHVNGHSNKRQYVCDLCGDAFIAQTTLRSHKQWKHSEVHYQCKHCEYRTKTVQKLNEHIRAQHVLNGVKPYLCPYCDFSCATGGNCRKHVINKHKGQRVEYLKDKYMISRAVNAHKSDDGIEHMNVPQISTSASSFTKFTGIVPPMKFPYMMEFSQEQSVIVQDKLVSNQLLLAEQNVHKEAQQTISTQPTFPGMDQILYPHTTVAPPSETTIAMVPPIGTYAMVVPPIETHTTLVPSVETHTTMVPPIGTHTTVAPPIGMHTTVAPPIEMHTTVVPPFEHLSSGYVQQW